MFRFLSMTVLVCVMMVAFSPSPAYAKHSKSSHVKSSESIRAAQTQLAKLGYYAGRIDGISGRVTKSAIREFQRHNGLSATGTLTSETTGLLSRKNIILHHQIYNGYYNPAYSEYYRIAYGTQDATISWRNFTHPIATQSLSNRFARIDVKEDRREDLSNFTVTVNGSPILIARNQASLLYVSKTIELTSEDAIIFSVYNGNNLCPYKNYLLTTRSNNTYAGPYEIGDCSDTIEVFSHNTVLLITFKDAFANREVKSIWRYENGSLVQL